MARVSRYYTFYVYNYPMSAIFIVIELNIFRTFPSLKPHLLFNSNGLAIWFDFQFLRIKWAEVGHFEFDQVETFHGISHETYMKPHILFYGNGKDSNRIFVNSIAIWNGFPLIMPF